MSLSTSIEEIDEIVKKARQTFQSGKTLDIEFRRRQLKQLLKLINENEEQFVKSLKDDMKRSRFETIMSDTEIPRDEVLHLIYHLDEYTAKQSKQKTLVNLFDQIYTYYEPLGLVFVIGAWNYPVLLVLNPLAGAIAAGNVVIMKPSELAPKTSDLLCQLIPQYLDPDCYFIASGGADVCQAILSHKLDHVFYTGSTTVGQKIYQAASKHLTPVTLELGGKSPAYIDSLSVTSKYQRMVTAKRILWGKFFNCGQTCIATDYLLCDQETTDWFVANAAKIWTKFTASASKDYARILNHAHYDRLSKLILETKGTVFKGQEIGCLQENDRSDNLFNLKIVTNVKRDDVLMQGELFGPILPIVTVKDHREAIDFINSMGAKPLTMYVFSNDQQVIDDFTKRTTSGSVCVNDTMLQMMCDSLPFGGVGESGLGQYHGLYTFKCFSHEKSVLVRGFNPILEWVASKRYPPYSNNHLVRMQRLLRKRKYFNVETFDKIPFKTITVFLVGSLYGYFVHSYGLY